MDELKNPSFAISVANSAGLVGVTIWLFRLNADLAAQVKDLTNIVKGFHQKTNILSHEYEALCETIDKLSVRSQRTNDQLKSFDRDHLEACLESLGEQAQTQDTNYSLPPKRKAKKNKYNSRASHKKQRYSESDDSQSDSDDDFSEEEMTPPRREYKSQKGKNRGRSDKGKGSSKREYRTRDCDDEARNDLEDVRRRRSGRSK